MYKLQPSDQDFLAWTPTVRRTARIERSLRDGTIRQVPASYLDAGHLDHGYAMTIHNAEGATVDHALVLATDDLYQEATTPSAGHATPMNAKPDTPPPPSSTEP